jgi:4-amino-4-deoxy-L-arabinose transferase-like glycosyltransferase
MIKKLTQNPFVLFSPFLFIYAYCVVINKWPALYGDEIRYVDFAHNLIHGYYSPSAPHINLWSGPGYPFILVPFIAVHVPVLYVTLLNALYQYLAVVFLYKAILLTTNRKIATISALVMAIYPNALAILPILYTEAFTYMLIAALIYTTTLFFVKHSRTYGVMAGVLLGYIALTKIIFGYVIVIGILACLPGLLFKKRRSIQVNSLKILGIAFAVTVPYLVYTWSLTGKVLYWGNSGGMSLYWMSTPYEHEYGDWKVPDLTNNQYPTIFKSPDVIKVLKKNHAREINGILKHNEIEQDELFKKVAISNIEDHPGKFISNYCDNLSRMLFNFPYSYAYQDDAILRNILTGSLILWSTIAGLISTWINRRKISPAVKFMLLITSIYLLLSAALSSYPRQFDVIIPVLLFWLSFLVANTKKLRVKFTDLPDLDDIDLNDLAEAKMFEKERIEYIAIKPGKR